MCIGGDSSGKHNPAGTAFVRCMVSPKMKQPALFSLGLSGSSVIQVSTANKLRTKTVLIR